MNNESIGDIKKKYQRIELGIIVGAGVLFVLLIIIIVLSQKSEPITGDWKMVDSYEYNDETDQYEYYTKNGDGNDVSVIEKYDLSAQFTKDGKCEISFIYNKGSLDDIQIGTWETKATTDKDVKKAYLIKLSGGEVMEADFFKWDKKRLYLSEVSSRQNKVYIVLKKQ